MMTAMKNTKTPATMPIIAHVDNFFAGRAGHDPEEQHEGEPGMQQLDDPGMQSGGSAGCKWLLLLNAP